LSDQLTEYLGMRIQRCSITRPEN